MSVLVELPAAEDVAMLVGEVWSTFLGEDARPYEIQRPAELPPQVLFCLLDITGNWNGTVTLSITEAGAVSLARAMFDDPDGELSRADVQDAVGELGNILAGNIKSCLPEPSVLSLPVVLSQLTPAGSGSQSRVDVALGWDEHFVLVNLTETDPQKESA